MKRFLCLLIAALVLYSWPAFAGRVIEVIDGNGTWTDPWYVEKGTRINVSIGDYNATTDMTLILQRKLPGDSNWRDVKDWDVTGSSEDKEYITAYPEPEGCWYRIGCNAASDYTSGNCTCRIGGGRR